MKVVEINTVPCTGSTGKICIALYKLAMEANITPYIAYGRDCMPADINGYKIGSKSDFYRHVLRNFCFGENGFGSTKQTINFINWLSALKPDIIHLHNIHGFYLNVEILFDYLKSSKIPVIWTLHDCWPFTGHCAYYDSIACDKWKTQCNFCPQYRTAYPYSLLRDNSTSSFERKKAAFTGVPNLTIVTPSLWLSEEISHSFLCSYPRIVIPNGIDLDVFTPPVAKSNNTLKTILGVANIWSKRKGLQYFEDLASLLSDDYIIKLVGLNKRQFFYFQKNYPNKIIPYMRTKTIEELVTFYQNANVFVNPTLEDNFPTTNLEALACGTPVITFNTGGSPESINAECGITVSKGSVSALISAITSLDTVPFSPENCRKQALKYADSNNFRKYINLYTALTNT